MKRLFCAILCISVLISAGACGKEREQAGTTEPAGDVNITQGYENNSATDYINYDETELVSESVADTNSQTLTTAQTTLSETKAEESTSAGFTQAKPTRPVTTIAQIATTASQVKPSAPSVSVTSVVCLHKNAVVKGKVNATSEYDGYTGDTYCSDCGVLLQKGEKTKYIDEGVQAGMVQYPCPDGSFITVPVGTNVFDYTMEKAGKSASHDFYDLEKEIFRLFNEERARLGIPTVSWNEDAYYYVKTRAIETQTLFSHTRPGGDNFSDVYEDEGIVLCAMAENLVGHMTVQEGEDIAYRIFSAIMSSASHKATALDLRYNQMCVSLTYYDGQYYFCQHMYENVVH